MCPKEIDDVLRCAIAQAQPDNLGRCALEHAEAMEVFVLGYEHAAMNDADLPEDDVGSAVQIESFDVQGIGIVIGEETGQSAGQLLVEEQAHVGYAAGMLSVRRSRSAAYARHARMSSCVS
jgi:hypothetical protein